MKRAPENTRSRRRRSTGVVLSLCLWLSAAGTLRAGEISVAWDPVVGATGYRVYYGSASRAYSEWIPSSVPSATVTGLADCQDWYIAVKAVNPEGESEEYSPEVAGWPRPSVTLVNPDAVMQGTQTAIELTGSNFQSGAAVEFDDSQLRPASVSVLSCTRLQLLVTAEPTAPDVRPARVGTHDVIVVNPDLVYGVGIAEFEVLIDPYRFDVNRSDDATRDRIDGKDTIYLSRQFGLSATNPAYDPDNDFDGDGWVDGSDLAYIASNLGRCWSAATSSWSASACPTGLR